MKRLLVVFMLIALVSGLAQAATAPSDKAANDAKDDSAVSSTPTFSSRTPLYKLCPTDSFDIDFPYTKEYNQSLTIRPDGFVNFRELGDMHVAGMTIPELTKELTERYSTILHDPVVNITLKQFNAPYFVVGGQVDKPGKYELRADTTVTEALAIAGAFNEKAKHSQVLLVRKSGANWAEVRELNVKEILKDKMQEDVHLQSGDMLFVPKNRISKIKPWIPIYGMNTTVPVF